MMPKSMQAVHNLPSKPSQYPTSPSAFTSLYLVCFRWRHQCVLQPAFDNLHAVLAFPQPENNNTGKCKWTLTQQLCDALVLLTCKCGTLIEPHLQELGAGLKNTVASQQG